MYSKRTKYRTTHTTTKTEVGSDTPEKARISCRVVHVFGDSINRVFTYNSQWTSPKCFKRKKIAKAISIPCLLERLMNAISVLLFSIHTIILIINLQDVDHCYWQQLGSIKGAIS